MESNEQRWAPFLEHVRHLQHGKLAPEQSFQFMEWVIRKFDGYETRIQALSDELSKVGTGHPEIENVVPVPSMDVLEHPAQQSLVLEDLEE